MRRICAPAARAELAGGVIAVCRSNMLHRGPSTDCASANRKELAGGASQWGRGSRGRRWSRRRAAPAPAAQSTRAAAPTPLSSLPGNPESQQPQQPAALPLQAVLGRPLGLGWAGPVSDSGKGKTSVAMLCSYIAATHLPTSESTRARAPWRTGLPLHADAKCTTRLRRTISLAAWSVSLTAWVSNSRGGGLV